MLLFLANSLMLRLKGEQGSQLSLEEKASRINDLVHIRTPLDAVVLSL